MRAYNVSTCVFRGRDLGRRDVNVRCLIDTWLPKVLEGGDGAATEGRSLVVLSRSQRRDPVPLGARLSGLGMR